MTLDQLVTLQAVSAAKSFRRAAELLHLTQPAVSKQIRALEEELGARLFERGRSARLTQAGETLLKHAERLSQILRSARDELEDLRGLRRGHLSIGASHSVATYVLPDLLESYRRKYPQVTLSVEAGWTPHVLSRVLGNDLDLGLVVLVTPKPSDTSQFVSNPLDTTEVVFVASPKHPLAKKGQVTFEEFREAPLILNQEGCLYRHFLETHFSERGFTMNVAVEVIGLELQKRLTQLGLGVALLPKPFVAKELREKSLKTFAVKGVQIRSYSCLVYRRDKYLHGAMRAFVGMLPQAFPGARIDSPPR
ncbi:MAG TPA: LysR family transcriptional regulator [Candidatus Acidoferrales bacterium]|nr:LysR family transcriptional regulator [Candidatus Acidoferrales bacterium]